MKVRTVNRASGITKKKRKKKATISFECLIGLFGSVICLKKARHLFIMYVNFTLNVHRIVP